MHYYNIIIIIDILDIAPGCSAVLFVPLPAGLSGVTTTLILKHHNLLDEYLYSTSRMLQVSFRSDEPEGSEVLNTSIQYVVSLSLRLNGASHLMVIPELYWSTNLSELTPESIPVKIHNYYGQ